MSFPTIVRFLGTDDSPDSPCPHCGATGRYIIRFEVEDGRTLAAMRGCVKLFPVSPLAAAEQFLLDKQARNAKQGWRLNRGDQYALDQIQLARAGLATEGYALAMCKIAKHDNQMRRRR